MEHRSAVGLFLSLAVHLNRPAAALNARLPLGRGVRALHTTTAATAAADAGDTSSYLVDVDANLLHDDLSNDIDHHIQVASSVGVKQFVVPGSTVEDSRGSLELARQKPNVVFSTAGVHPYHVQGSGSLEDAMASIATLAATEEARCVGECGLDYSEGFPAAELQLPWFERQVELACKLKKPLFLHERAAFVDFSEVLRRYDASHGLPPCLVHCFTGSEKELTAYIEMGFFVSVAGGICREKSGAALREAVKRVPLDRLMVETDAPYLGFSGCRKGHNKPKKQNPNVPSALPAVVRVLAECLGLPFEEVARATLQNSRQFFGMATL
ncbi:unnamed protein product [Ectocarpus fasciculatus]